METGELASWSGFTLFKVVNTAYDRLSRKIQESLSSPGGAVQSKITVLRN